MGKEIGERTFLEGTTVASFGLISVTALAGCSPKDSSSLPPSKWDTEESSMSTNKDILFEFVDAVSMQDLNKLASLFTEDCVYEDVAQGGTMLGREEVKAGYNQVFSQFPDFKLEIKSYFIAEDAITSEWVMTGTSKTGKSFSTRGVTIDQLRGGKIQKNRDYYDPSGILNAGV
jgi:steroid delta-isomerase-like uncharacterized protein